MEAGTLVKVIRDFLTLNEGELSVVKNDVLQVLEEVDRLWIKCRNARDQGQVPKSHLHPIEHDLRVPELGHVFVICESEFKGETEGDLTIQKGDILIALESIGNVQLFVNLIFILYARWRFKVVCFTNKARFAHNSQKM